MSAECHIASLIVYARSEQRDAVAVELNRIEGLDIHAIDPTGKLIITLETDSEADILDCISRIQGIAGVLGANLVYHQIDHQSENELSLEEGISDENHPS